MTTKATPPASAATSAPGGADAFAVEYVNRRSLPVMLIDERRFGSDEGFAPGEERVLWAGVLTTAGELVSRATCGSC